MDHNLEDSLNLESAIGVDFGHSEDVVVSQADITLDTSSHSEGIPMEFEHIEEQPILMDTGNEEIIVSDFMGDQFTLQELSVDGEQMAEATTTVESNEQNVFTSESDTMIDLQFEPQSISVPTSSIVTPNVELQPKVVAVKSTVPSTRPIAKKDTVVFTKASVAPRQVPIAPKPPNLNQSMKIIKQKATFLTGKTAISAGSAPVSLMKRVSLPTTLQGNVKGNTVLAQVGKQFIMMPAGGGHKIKLVTAGTALPAVRLIGSTDSNQKTQLTSNQNLGSQLNKPKMAKLIIQGNNTDPARQQATLTKVISAPSSNAASGQTRYVTMQQKTVPISIGNNTVLLTTSPTKQGVKLAGKHHVIAMKSPQTPKLVPTTSHNTATKKVLITANPQNVILKTTAPPKTGVITKNNVGQRTQLHQINVPGKGIQYIRLVTNPTPAPPKLSPKPALPAPGKSFVLTDGKGNLIHMTAEKMVSGQPPPLVVTGTAHMGHKVTAKPQQRLVKIAPVATKSAQVTVQARSGQSLLAPLSPVAGPQTTFEEVTDLLEERERLNSDEMTQSEQTESNIEYDDVDPEDSLEQQIEDTETDSKAALQALIEKAVNDDGQDEGMPEGDHEFDAPQSPIGDERSSPDRDGREDRPLIVIPSYMKQEKEYVDDTHNSRKMSNLVTVEGEPYNNRPYPSPPTPPQPVSDPDVMSMDLGLRPRKACNCTKSQCLKLYCDCFANGEFCNRCNCNNCHNNLENEELRQKAIRGCLDRNPNAFRPKIGKAKIGGPDIIRRHNKGCNCKRSGCLKNYCECYEAKIACSGICKCVGCRNVEETVERARRRDQHHAREHRPDHLSSQHSSEEIKQPCSFMTSEVIEAVCQCLIAAAVESGGEGAGSAGGAGSEDGAGSAGAERDPVRDVIEEFARCLQDIISAAHHTAPMALLDETHA